MMCIFLRSAIFLLCSVFLGVSSALYATDLPPQAAADIDYLLGFVERSDACFIRSGKEYSGKEAADHLRMKLSKAGSRVKTPEDFIQGIASKSYLTGEAYRVKFPDSREQAASAWLHEALVRHRKSTSR